MTPNIAIVHIANPGWRGFRLWIPLFLLWIPLILLSPLIFFVLVFACIVARLNVWHTIAVFWGVLCSLPGTGVRVHAEGHHVLVEIF
jgi:hypothetical protein